MLIEIKVPVLSESVAEATLATWHRQEGEYVSRDENLADIETDKVVLELPAPASGTLTRVMKGNGSTVSGGEVIATLDTDGIPAAEPAPVNSDAVIPVPSQPTIPVMPSAMKLSREKNISLQDVKGTGRDGRITKADVVAYEATSRSATTSAPYDAGMTETGATQVASVPMHTASRPEQRVPMTRLRARIAERLVQSQSTAAILTTFNEVNMRAVMTLRARYKDQFEKEHSVKLGFTSFFVRAVLSALKQFPVVNASVDGNDIIYHGYYDIGVAVSSSRGLVVPVIRDADKLTAAAIEQKVADFGKRAQEGKLTMEELTGGTFSMTNGGIFGSMFSTPIINPPQSAILGIHAITDRPVAENGQIVIRPMVYLALSYDHRIIDGREAVLSLAAIKEALEYPVNPLLES